MTEKISLIISGVTGRMGRCVARMAQLTEGVELAGGITSKGSSLLNKTFRDASIADSDALIYDIDTAKAVLDEADVVVSFTTPAAEIENIETFVRSDVCLVVGTTGFSDEQLAAYEERASKIPTVFSSNFSVGANVILQLVKSAVFSMRDFDFSIIEAHHRKKADSPSGTALAFAAEIIRGKGYTSIINGRSGRSVRSPSELEVFSVRSGGIPGIHIILAGGDHETLEIKHTVFSRDAFASGALKAAKWIVDKPSGIYSMSNVLGLI
ncbi:MAG: 4-hydroxy-tetrahydrodipicolinate reductase [Conexivisphaerales archaeon]